MPASYMTLFPQVTSTLKGFEYSLKANMALADMASQMMTLGFGLGETALRSGFDTSTGCMPHSDKPADDPGRELMTICRDTMINASKCISSNLKDNFDQYGKKCRGDVDFLGLFTKEPPAQEWGVAFKDEQVLLDLPGMRLIDISTQNDHAIENYTVIFSPRAGHHSNIAERTALHLRDRGLTRIAIVEQKCADDIPMYVDGKRHYENFDGQVEQYRQVLSHLKSLTGHAPHLVAICQPGPLLISTLILYPELGRTFGSAGSPMHTEGEKGFLTDFSRQMGESYIDKLLQNFPTRIAADKIGAGREVYDGRLHVFGFYYLGMDQHSRNFRRLLEDCREGNTEAAERQKQFYGWYNYAMHFPAGFIRDTFKKVFVGNELVRGTLKINGRYVRIKDYPTGVPIWSLGGTKDAIVPPKQAVGHVDLIDSLSEDEKLTELASAGHMGLFRSYRVLGDHYGKIADFILEHSDSVYTREDKTAPAVA